MKDDGFFLNKAAKTDQLLDTMTNMVAHQVKVSVPIVTRVVPKGIISKLFPEGQVRLQSDIPIQKMLLAPEFCSPQGSGC